MTDSEEHEFTRPRLSIVVAVLLLPLFYLASVGPIIGLVERGIVSEEAWETMCESVFLPLAWIETRTKFFDERPGSTYIWYLQLFEP
jgi:hypothetical protein